MSVTAAGRERGSDSLRIGGCRPGDEAGLSGAAGLSTLLWKNWLPMLLSWRNLEIVLKTSLPESYWFR